MGSKGRFTGCKECLCETCTNKACFCFCCCEDDCCVGVYINNCDDYKEKTNEKNS